MPLPLPATLALAAGACNRRRDTPAYTDPARTIRAAPGSEFLISLRSNQSTGYKWVLVDSARMGPLHSAGSRYAVPREMRDRDDAGGTEWWTFQALPPGEGTVSMIYVRRWERRPPATPPAPLCQVQVRQLSFWNY